MIRVRSTDVWFNAPGIQAAYQPVAAPDSLAARQNVGNDLRMAGRHTAMPGVLPTHDPRTGWGFTAASSQYLDTGIKPSSQSWSYLLRFANVPTATTAQTRAALGTYDGTNITVVMYPWSSTGPLVKRRYYNANFLDLGNYLANGVMAMAGRAAYINGVSDGTISDESPTAATVGLRIGDLSPSVHQYFQGDFLALAISSITLTPAHVAHYSRQIAYCHVNPDWNAWGRRRRYYYAPSAAVAAFQAAWAARANSVIQANR